MASRSKGKPLPASAPEPSGRTSARRRGFAEALPIAREHLEVGQQVVRPQHRLGAPHVRIAGDHGAGVGFRKVEQRRHHTAQKRARAAAFLPQPEARIERDLLVAAAAGVDLIGHRPRLLLQLADDQRVDVLVGGALVKRRGGRIGADLLEGADNRRALFGGEDADLFERAGEGLRAAYIGIDQPPVEIERAGEALEDLRWSGFETSAPELHLAFAARARTLMGSPMRLMKPSASFWS